VHGNNFRWGNNYYNNSNNNYNYHHNHNYNSNNINISPISSSKPVSNWNSGTEGATSGW
jgi:hypothetical protein